MSLETFLQGGPGQDGSRKSTKHKKIKQCKKQTNPDGNKAKNKPRTETIKRIICCKIYDSL